MGKLSVLFVAVAAVAGCSTVQVRSTASPNASLSQLRTFAFMTPVREDTRAAQLAESPAGQQIRNQITQDLVDKGYTPAPAGVAPDFLVAYRGLLERKTDIQSWPYAGPGWGWGWGWGWGGWAWGGPDVTISQYTEGTLVVDFVDPRTHQVVWRGTATSVVSHPHNPNLQKVAKAVDKLMKRLPPSAMASRARTTL